MIKKWTNIGACLVTLMIIVGGLTRITDSGLSITEFELVDGVFPPLYKSSWDNKFNKYKNTSEFKLINYNMNLADFKSIYWWEYIHRLLGRIIGIFFLIPVLFKKIFFKQHPSFYNNYVYLFFLTFLQGIVGWYMVVSGLVEGAINVSHFRLAVHLFLAVVLFIYLLWTLFSINSQNIDIIGNKRIYNLLVFLIPIVFLQIIFGAFMSGTGAGHQYHTFPTMNGQFIPDSLFAAYGKNGFMSLVNNQGSIQFIHRILGVIIFSYCFFLWFNFYFKISDIFIKHGILALFVIIIFQSLFGVFSLILDMPMSFRILHHLGFVFFVFFFVRLFFFTKKRTL